MFHILVVDDDRDLALALKRSLEDAGYQVTIAYSGPQALEQLRQQIPDLVVLDIVMEHMDGIAVCEHVRSHPALQDRPILFLTANRSIESKAVAFAAGGDDYLPKPFDVEELLLRIRVLLRRSEALSANHRAPLLQVGGLTLDCQTFEVFTEQSKACLTPVEFELLHCLMGRPGKVFSPQELLEEVWDYPTGDGSPDLVRRHVLNLRSKIEPQPRQPTYILTVLRRGYTVLGG